MLSLSTCWNSHRHHEDGLQVIEEALSLGFESVELSHGLSSVLLPGFYKAFEQGLQTGRPLIHFSGVHNFCPSPVEVSGDRPDVYEFTSRHRLHRERAIKLTRRSIDVASDLGGKYVVLHLGHSAMRDYTSKLTKWAKAGEMDSKSFAALKAKMIRKRVRLKGRHLDQVRTALDQLIPYAEGKGICLGLESRSRFEQVPNEEEMEILLGEYDTPAVGYWHDFGHVQLKENLNLLDHRAWLEKMSARLIGCHLHDVIAPADDHAVPFQGNMDFDRLMPLVGKNVPLVWEMHPRRKADEIKAARLKWEEKYG